MRTEVVVLLLGAATVVVATQRNPFHNLPENAVCVPGSRWLDVCNWCWCGDNGRAACTFKGCLPGYKHEGPTCEGNSVWRSDCNTCRCVNGVSACTKRLCRRGKSLAIEPPALPDDTDCTGNPTDRWRKDCNWCSCRNGRGACTRRMCPQGRQESGPQCEGNPVWKEDCNTCKCVDGAHHCTTNNCDALDEQTKEGQTPSVQNAECEEGSRWRVECNWCHCTDGVKHCTKDSCEDWSEAKAQEEGVLECHGTSRWKKDCNWCSCFNGRGICTLRACIPPERDPFHNLPGNAVCVPGSRWLDVCNWCHCGDNGLAACTLKGCPPSYKHEGPTCEGDSVWRSDDCNTCRCVNGVSACTKRLCPTPPSVAKEPECQGDPQTDRWRMDCNWCSCRNGIGVCTRRACPQGVEDDEPVCVGNASWMRECNRCHCHNGAAVCTSKYCGPLPPQTSVRTGVKTEPACQSEAETDYWTQDCNRCSCRDGVPGCTKRLCRPGEDTTPVCSGNPSWKQDCNVCRCNNGQVVCTKRLCGIPNQTKTRRGEVEIVKDNEKSVCKDGSRWRVGCNWCSCHDGTAFCTLKACLDQSVESREPECEGDASWKDDCNWCTCGAGLAVCTRMGCLTDGNKVCIEGATWFKGCNLCRCSHGFTLCTKESCGNQGRNIGCTGEGCGSGDLPALCHLPAVRESQIQCTAFFMMWTFSASEKMCKQIVYGGCGGTENLFDTEEECKAACPTTIMFQGRRTSVSPVIQIPRISASSKISAQGSERCHLPKESGPCFGSFRRYAHNVESGVCEEFLYGGCAGNGNNFHTKQECTAACQGTQVCDKSKCPWAFWGHYLAKECVPQYVGDACCPTSFQCPSMSKGRKDLTKCFYKGVSYNIGDAVPVTEPCSASCRCLKSHVPDTPAKITCANVECPDLFRPPTPGCRPLYKPGDCCAYDHECQSPDQAPFDPRADSSFCSWQNKTYYIGAQMYFDDYPCQTCICGQDFTDPTGPGCSKVDCGLDFRYTDRYDQGCTPIYFEDGCCPIDWMCPDDSRLEAQHQQQQQQQQADTTDESAVCHLGDLRFAVGQVVGLTDCRIECRCMTPPELTCIQYRSCELAQEIAAQRACPSLKCKAGCHPVMDKPGDCPTCSCSSDLVSCPAHTCPSNCDVEVDLQTGCPTCKCKCEELICPTGCPSHTVLDEATGCPRCECKPGSEQLNICPVYPGDMLACPMDCAVIRTVDENGCEVCKCDPNDDSTPFGPPVPVPRLDICHRKGEAPCPMDCAIIRRMDGNGCEVCECNPNDFETPFGPPVPQHRVY